MQKLFRRKQVIGAALLVAVLGVSAVAMARQGAVSIPLYKGIAGSIDLGAWGSGNATEVDKPVLVGNRAVRITTQGLYQGGRLTFKDPVDLSAAFANPKTYLRLMARFDTTAMASAPSGPSGPIGPGGSGREGGSPGGGGNFGGVEQQRVAASPFDRMRYVLTMADGSRYELVRPVVLPPTEDPDSYVPLAFPIQALLKKGDGTKAAVPSGDGAKLKEIDVFGDKYQQFMIGEMEVVTDNTDIDVASLEEPIVFTNDLVTFSGSAEGGATTLHYSWDFDASDGIQEDAVGRTVTHVFKNSGKTTVTLTVSDEDGIKQSDQKSVTFDITGNQ